MTFVSIQHLRAVAATMVVIIHLHPQWTRMGYDGPWPFWLSSGVDIFFVISGFIMWQTTYDRRKTALEFYIQRVKRIVPMYWLLTSLVVAVMLVAPHRLQSGRYDFWHVITSYLFIPHANPGNGALEPVLIPGWTLNYEMFFYLLFGLSLTLPQRLRLGTMAIMLCGLVSLRMFLPHPGTLESFYSSGIVLEFLFGMVLGHLLTSGRLSLPVPAARLLLVLGFALLPALSLAPVVLPRVIAMGLPALLIVCGAIVLETHGITLKSPFLLALGDVSYTLYLSHPIVLSATSQFWRRLGLDGFPWSLSIFSLLACVLACVLSFLLYRFLEQPINRALHGGPRKGFEAVPGR